MSTNVIELTDLPRIPAVLADFPLEVRTAIEEHQKDNRGPGTLQLVEYPTQFPDLHNLIVLPSNNWDLNDDNISEVIVYNARPEVSVMMFHGPCADIYSKCNPSEFGFIVMHYFSGNDYLIIRF